MEKKRSLNFSKLETNLLIQLVEQKKDILECSKLDPISIEKRNSAWREITDNFNGHYHSRTFRDEKMLKKKYSNIKCHTKSWTETTSSSVTELISELPKREEDKIDVPIIPVQEEKNKADNTNIETIRPEPSEKFKTELTINTELLTMENKEKATILEEYFTSDGKEEFEFDEHHYNTEYDWNGLEDIIDISSQEIAKLEMTILENKHKEHMEIMKMKHNMQVEKLELQKERLQLKMELLDTEIAFKRKKPFNGIVKG